MDNLDLEKIENEINARKEKQEVTTTAQTPSVPVIDFGKVKPDENTENIKTSKDTAGELVENAFSQAVIHRVQTDESVQNELLDSAEKVIKNKTNAIKEQAELEDKTAHFNNRKGACECFGYNETTTEKWAVNCMNVWHNIATAVWIFIGAFTFAPITFVAKKIVVIFKIGWIAFVVAILIYIFIAVGIPHLIAYT
jgi:hypothetical protein